MLKLNEQGRSMLETLGVMAIVGVLTVTGVHGYQAAMNKHRANELMNEASKRATVVASHLMAGKDIGRDTAKNSDLLSEFEDAVGRFKLAKKNDEQFYIEVADVSPEVCEQMKSLLGTVLRDISECPTDGNGTIILTFNNDMSSDPKPGDNDGNSTACITAGNQYCPLTDVCITTNKPCPIPSCSAYPGTDISNTGGKAGVADDEKTACRCPENEVWCPGNNACSDRGLCIMNIGDDKCYNWDSETGDIIYVNNGTLCDYGLCYNGRCMDAHDLTESDCSSFNGTWCEYYDKSHFCSLDGKCCVLPGLIQAYPPEGCTQCSCTFCDASTNWKWTKTIAANSDGETCGLSAVCYNGECVTESDCTSLGGTWCEWKDGSKFCSRDGDCCNHPVLELNLVGDWGYVSYNGKCVSKGSLTQSDCSNLDGAWCTLLGGYNYCALSKNCCSDAPAVYTNNLPAVPCHEYKCDASTNNQWEDVTLPDKTKCSDGSTSGLCYNGSCVTGSSLKTESECSNLDGTWCTLAVYNYCALSKNCCSDAPETYTNNLPAVPCHEYKCDASTNNQWEDVTLPDGTECGKGTGLCYSGECVKN